MSRTEPETDIVDAARALAAGLAAKPGCDAAIREGADIAAIVEPLGLSPDLRAAVHLYPLLRDECLDIKTLESDKLEDISRTVLGLVQLGRFSLPPDWKPGEALAVQQLSLIHI